MDAKKKRGRNKYQSLRERCAFSEQKSLLGQKIDYVSDSGSRAVILS